MKYNYKFDYLTVKRHAGGQLVPCVNVLAKLAERRALDIQSLDYADRFQLFNSISIGCNIDQESLEICKFLEAFDKLDNINRYKLLCTVAPNLSEEGLESLFKQIPTNFGEHYKYLGPDKILSTGCNITFMNKYLQDVLNPFQPETLDSEVYSNFNEGQRYLLSEIKDILKVIYQNNDVQKGAVATDINNYYETKPVKIYVDKKQYKGYELIKKIK